MGPWGTPQVRGAREEDASPMDTEKVLFDKYEFTPFESGVPDANPLFQADSMIADSIG